jgi:carbon monoxide dehydrogenase subunit G
MIRAVFNLDAPRQTVFEALTDFARYASWLPGCERCEIVSAEPNMSDVQISINSIRRLELGLRFEYEPSQSVRFRMTKGKDIKAYSGAHKLMDSADGKGTVVMAELDIDGGSFAPKFIVDRIASQALHDIGEALKLHVRSLAKQVPGASSAPVAEHGPVVEHRNQRNKRILSVMSTPAGYRMQLFGKAFQIDERNKSGDSSGNR